MRVRETKRNELADPKNRAKIGEEVAESAEKTLRIRVTDLEIG